MNINSILNKYLIVNDDYENELISDILEDIYRDCKFIYKAAERNSESGILSVLNDNTRTQEKIKELIGGITEQNASNILLFLSKLPVIAIDFANDLENNKQDITGIRSVIARDSVNKYMKGLFCVGYDKLYEYEGKKQISNYLYYECEKLIDVLALEFKQNISPMIDAHNLVYDDLFYVRRLIKNMENANENRIIGECVDCERDCAYIRCRTWGQRDFKDKELEKLKKLSKILDARINGGVSSSDIEELNDEDYLESLVKKVCLLNANNNEKKQILIKGDSKLFSIISAKRFETILRRRYNREDYSKDKDIYYILLNGIDSSSIFTGDNLLESIDKIHKAYTENNDESQI